MKKEMINLVFDLQLFDGVETVAATGSDELITIAKYTQTGGGEAVKVSAKIETNDARTLSENANLVDAGSGNDTISVGSGVENVTIIGGKGNDSIDLSATDDEKFNTYQYGEGDGYDTIKGWKSGDTLEITSGITTADALAKASMMSADGNDFILKVGTNTITFKDITPGATQVKVKIGEDTITINVPKLRQGTSESDEINNLTGQDARKAGVADGIYIIDAGAGYDTVKNDANYISISGGAGNDLIEIKAAPAIADPETAAAVASNVTINAGTGNDTIDTSKNTIEGGTGNVVYEYAEGDGNDVIIGFHQNDTIKITTTTAALTADAIKAASEVSGNDYIIRIGTGSITIQNAVGGTNFYLSVNGTAITDDSVATFSIPKEIKGTSVGEVLTAAQDEYVVNALEGNDIINVTAAKVTVNAGDGNDLINLTGGTNVPATVSAADAAVAAAAKAVVVNGGAGNDTIDATADKKDVTNGEDTPETLKENVVATHIYEYKEGDGNDVIYGWNDSDTIKVTLAQDSTITIDSSSAIFDGTDLKINIGSGSIVLKDVTGGDKLNLLVGGATVEGLTTIPQKITGTDSADEYNVTVEDYIVDALSGNDKITVAAGSVSVNAGDGNDTITLLDGTNVPDTVDTTNDAKVNDKVVTIVSGAGNDYIDASNDFETVTIGTGDETITQDVYASHVYQFGSSDGSDIIKGFNSSDTIVFNVAENVAITGDFSDDGKSYILKAGSTSVTLEFDNNFKQGNQIQVYKKVGENSTAVEIGTQVTINSKQVNIIPKIKYGTSTHDTITTEGATGAVKIVNQDSGYSIDMRAGDDLVENQGASNVSIFGGAGNDTITLTRLITTGNSPQTIYGENVTIEGGTGNDYIVAESLPTSDSQRVDDAAPGHIYYFGSEDGNDTIAFYNDKDVIVLKDNDVFLGATFVNYKTSTVNNVAKQVPQDVLVKIGKDGATNATATILLKGYAKDGPDTTIKYKTGFEGTETSSYVVPKVRTGDNDTDKNDTIENIDNEYRIEALTGNDTITNSGNNVSIFGGTGNDIIVNSGESALINGEGGADLVSLTGGRGAEISVGADNDTIVVDYSDANQTQSGNVYTFGNNDGTNYILNYRPDDAIRFVVDGLTQDSLASNITNTADGLKIVVGNTTVYVKGALTEGATDKANPASYELLKGGTLYNLKINDDAIYQETVGYAIFGTNSNDEISNINSASYNADGYVIDALAGNDTINSGGVGVSISAGNGNDIITLADDAAANTINAGAGNDVIYGNSKEHVGHIYEYKEGDGNDTIYGFTAKDTIKINDGNYTSAETTSEGFVITTSSGKILLKGEKKADGSGYHNVEGGTIINIADNDDGTAATVKVESILMGSSAADTLENIFDNYKIDALDKNDLISNTGNNVTISGGAGADTINLNGGTGVTVNGGAGNDLINVNDSNGHIIEFAAGDGLDSVVGLNANDTIKFAAGTEYTAAFDSEKYYVLTINSTTKIKLIGKDNAKLNGKTFYVQIGDADAEPVVIPNEIAISEVTAYNPSAATTLTSAENAGIITATSDNDTIYNDAANNATINAGQGADVITIDSGASSNVIIGGKGDDTITFANSTGHTVEYNSGDGNDVITGWNETDVLKISGLTETQLEGAISLVAADVSPTNAGNLEIKVGTSKIVLQSLVPQSKVRFAVDEMSDDKEYVEYTVPKLVQGTSKNDTLANVGDGYEINAFAGDDTITSAYSAVTIDAGPGNDTIISSGNNAVISGDTGNDIINSTGDGSSIEGGEGNDEFVIGGIGATARGGAGNDKISLTSAANTSVIEGGAGKDTIYGNGNGNVYVYDLTSASAGDDIILGFDAADTIQIIGGSVASSKVTADGYIITFANDKGTLTLKGTSTEENATDRSKFNNLTGGTVINIQTKATAATVGWTADNITVANEKYIVNNTITNTDANHTIYASTIADTITNSGDKVTIQADKGADLIKNTGAEVSINAGDGNDTIVMTNAEGGAPAAIPADNANAAGVTIEGGKNDDLIYGNDKGHVYKFTSGDGNDTIYNFSEADVISLGASTALTSTIVADTNDVAVKDVTLKFASGSILLKGVKVESIIKLIGENATNLTVPKQLTFDTTDAETINNADYLIYGSDKNNNLTNSAANVTVDAGKGNNTITNSGAASKIITGQGNDNITNNAGGANVTIEAGAGADTITNSVSDAVIDAGAAADRITIDGTATNVSINAGAGNDTIWGNDTGGQIYFFDNTDGGFGKDVIYNYRSEDLIELALNEGEAVAEPTYKTDSDGEGYYEIAITKNGNTTANTITLAKVEPGTTVNIKGKAGGTAFTAITKTTPKIITGTKGNDANDANLNNTQAEYEINALAGNDQITNSGENVTIDAGDGEDLITNATAATGTKITAGKGNDIVENYASSVTIDAGAGTDLIRNEGSSVSISAGADNDTIVMNNASFAGLTADITVAADAANVTIEGGKGNDLIYGNDNGHIYQYTSGDGADTIYGFTESDKISLGANTALTDSVVADTTDDNEKKDVTLTFANGSTILLKDLAVSTAINFIKSDGTVETKTVPKLLTAENTDALNNTLEGFTIEGTKNVANTITNSGANVTIDALDGTNTITNNAAATNTEITTGKNEDNITNAADGVTISSAAGDDLIKNTGSAALINTGDGADTVVMTNATIAPEAIRAGGATASNVTIEGGKGDDVIYSNSNGNVYKFTKGDGNDTIYNFSEADVILLGEDTALTDSVVADTGKDAVKDVTLKFGAGNSIVLKGVKVESAIKLTNATGTTTTYTVPKQLTANGTTALNNTNADYNIEGTTANNNITNSGANVLINANKGANTITNQVGGTNTTITADSGNDTITNNAVSVLIDAGDGKNLITNAATGTSTTINSGSGADTVDNSATDAVISTGAGTDRITVSGSATNVSINAGAGNDSIWGNATGGQIYYFDNTTDDGFGRDVIYNYNAADTIELKLAENQTVSGSYDASKGYILTVDAANTITLANINPGTDINVKGTIAGTAFTATFTSPKIITGTASAETISNTEAEYTINALAGADTITNSGESVTINAGDGNNQITNDTNASSTQINSGRNNDTIINKADEVTISSAAGTDLIKNTGSAVSISAGDGADTIVMTNATIAPEAIRAESAAATNVTIEGGKGNDVIYGNDNGHIYKFTSGDGDDIIYGFTEADKILVGGNSPVRPTITSADVVGNSQLKDVTLKFASGSIVLKNIAVDSVINFVNADFDSYTVPKQLSVTGNTENILDDYFIEGAVSTANNITNSGQNVTINAQNGNNTITNQADGANSSISAGTGNDTITNSAANVTISAGNGNNTIKNDTDAAGTEITAGTGNDSITNKAANVTINAGAGKNVIENSGGEVEITTTTQADSINNSGVSATISTGNGNDTIDNKAADVSIDAGTGDDYISNTGDGVTIIGGDGKDTISNTGSDVLINAGNGDDFITLTGNATNVTINLGEGSDTVYGNEKGGQIFVIDSTANMGNKLIVDYNSEDSIQITLGDGQTLRGEHQPNTGYVISVMNGDTTVGTITLAKKDQDNKLVPIDGGTALNIEAKYSNGNAATSNVPETAPKIITGTESNDKNIENSAEDYLINALGGNDTIKNTGANVTIDASTGNNVITNGEENTDAGLGTKIITAYDNNNITNYAANVTISTEYNATKKGKNTIVNKGAESKITTFAGDDTITNDASYVTINAGAGKNVITNKGSDSKITTGEGNDSIYNDTTAAAVIINTGDGNDTIHNKAADVSINAGAGKNVIVNEGGDGVTIIAGADEDTISNNASEVQINAGAGSDKIYLEGEAANVSITLGAGDDTVYGNTTGGYTFFIDATAGLGNKVLADYQSNDLIQLKLAEGQTVKETADYNNDGYVISILDNGNATVGTITLVKSVEGSNSLALIEGDTEVNIKVTDSNNTITNKLFVTPKVVLGTSDNDTLLTNESDEHTIIAYEGKDTIENTGNNVIITANEGGIKTITNEGTDVTITSGAANDAITNFGSYAVIDAGAGDDVIKLDGSYTITATGDGAEDTVVTSAATGVSINAGAGNDTIYGNSAGGNIYYFDSADTGANVIANYQGSDELRIYLHDDETLKAAEPTTANDGYKLYVEKADGTSAFSIILKSADLDLVAGGVNVTANIVNASGTIIDTQEFETPKVKFGTAAADTIEITEDESGYTVNVFGGNDNITNAGEANTINSTAGNNIVVNSGANAEINLVGNNGTDRVTNTGEGATINTGSGIDTIYNGADSAYISAGDGNDIIELVTFTEQTVDEVTTTVKTAADSENVTINGGGGNDNITLKEGHTKGVVFEYKTGDGNDTITNFTSADSIKIDGDYSTTVTNDGFRINVSSGFILLKGLVAEDDEDNPTFHILTPNAEGEYTSKEVAVPNVVAVPTTGDDKNTYTNTSEHALINGTTGNDTISNSATDVAIYGGNGNDSIKNTAADVYIDGGNGNNTVENSGANAVIKGGTGADSITNSGASALISISGGTNNITNDNAANVSIIGGTGIDNITNSGGEAYINAGNGNNNITNNDAENVTILGGTGTDNITNSGAAAYIDAGNGTNNINNSADSVIIKGGTGADNVTNTGGEVFIDAGAGNDNIYSSGNSVTIDGGAGVDNIYIGTREGNVITLEDAEGVIIAPGAGNDNISVAADHVNSVTYQFGKADGNNSIINFNANDIIQVTEEINTAAEFASLVTETGTGANVTRNVELTIGATKVSLKGYGATGDIINVQFYNAATESYETTEIAVPAIQFLTTGNDNVEITNDNEIGAVQALAGNDTITNSKDELAINAGAGNDRITNSGANLLIDGDAGNDSITNESGGSGVSITGGAGADSITNEAANVVIYGGAGADSIINSNSNVLIDAGADADRITVSGTGLSDITVIGGAGNDSIEITGERSANSGITFKYSVGDGNDSINGFDIQNDRVYIMDEATITGSSVIAATGYVVSVTSGRTTGTLTFTGVEAGNVIKFTTADNQELQITAPSVWQGTAGNDTYENPASGQNVKTMLALAGNDNITNHNSGTDANNMVVITATAGTNTITNDGAFVDITGGSAIDYITNTASNVNINGGNGNNGITINGGAADPKKSNITVTGGTGNDTVEIKENTTAITVNAGAGNDKITNAASENVLINGEAGNDTIDNTAENVTIDGGAGNDSLINDSANVSIFGDAGADSIINSSSNVWIDAGADADRITVSGSDLENITIIGGRGNDSIDVTDAKRATDKGFVYQYSLGSGNNGDGNDSISGFDVANDKVYIMNEHAADSITITGATAVPESGFVVSIRGGNVTNTITFKGVTVGQTVTFVDASGNNTLGTAKAPAIWQGTTGNDTLENVTGGDKATVEAMYMLAGNDTITNKISGTAAVADPATEEQRIIIATNEAKAINVGGNKKITNTGSIVDIVSGSGNDTIDNSGSNVSINAGAGTNYITVAAESTAPENVTVTGGTAADNIYVNAKKSVIDAGAGANNVTIAGGSEITLLGGAGNDSIHIADGVTKVTATLAAGNDKVTNAGGEVYIELGAGADSIENTGEKVTIVGDAGADVIKNTAANVSIDAGNDADRITLESTVENVTINAGAGNDSIWIADGITRTNGLAIQYSVGGGNDYISGFDVANDKVYILGDIDAESIKGSTVIGAAGFAVSVGSNVLTFAGVNPGEEVKFDVAGNEVKIKAPTGWEGTAGADNITNDSNGKFTAMHALAGNDTITNEKTGEAEAPITITATAGNNRITNSGAHVEITSGAGTDSIINSASNVTITGGTGANNITISGGESEITDIVVKGGTGADNIISKAKNVDINAGNGANSISLEGGDHVTITGGTGNDNVLISDTSTVDVNLGDGANRVSVKGTSENITITGGIGSEYAVISGGKGVKVDLGAGTNYASVQAEAQNVTITGGAAADNIFIGGGTGVEVNTGLGNDNISVTGGTGVTVNAGEGNDRINLASGAEGVLINYGGGADSIWGFSDDDFIAFSDVTGEISTSISGNNVLVKAGDTTVITLVNSKTAFDGKTLVADGGKYKIGAAPAEEEPEETSGDSGVGARIAEEQIAAMDLFEDNNFMSNDAQISDITAITHDNYSAGDIETLDLEKVVQSNYATSAAYGKDKK